MSTTKGEFPKHAHDDMVDAFSYAFNVRRKWVYDWKMIVGFIFYNLVAGALYLFVPSTQPFLFFLILGNSATLIFRPFTKRLKEFPVPPTTIHRKRIDGQ